MNRKIAHACLIAVLISPVRVAGQAAKPEAFRPTRIALDLAVDFKQRRLAGSVTYELENWTSQPASDLSLLLNRLMEASAVSDQAGRAIAFRQDVARFADTPLRQVTQIKLRLARPVPPGGHATLRVDYAGNLVGYTEVGWLYVHDNIDTAFTILRSDALAYPVVGGINDAANRKIPWVDYVYTASIRVPTRYLVATGGAVTRAAHPDGTTTWTYDSGRPSPVLNICIAPFDTVSSGGIRVFYFAADSAGAKRLLSSANAALRTMTQWFGPLHEEPRLTISEIPDGWGSQASLVGGIIQTAAAFRDPDRVGELYHELSHLWNAPDADRLLSPRWNEGLASFLEDLVRERQDRWAGRMASDAAMIVRVRDRVSSDSALRTIPFIDYGKRGMTRNSYSVGDLMFATLYDLVGGAEFNRIVGGYYGQFAQGGTTPDFIAFARRTSSRDLTAFFADWMTTPRWTDVLRSASTVQDLADHYRTGPP